MANESSDPGSVCTLLPVGRQRGSGERVKLENYVRAEPLAMAKR